MIKLAYLKTKLNESKTSCNISFRVNKEFYDTINTPEFVEDIGLAVMAALEKEFKTKIELDSLDTAKVEIKEKYEE